MKYTVSIEIALPRERVVQLLAERGTDVCKAKG